MFVLKRCLFVQLTIPERDLAQFLLIVAMSTRKTDGKISERKKLNGNSAILKKLTWLEISTKNYKDIDDLRIDFQKQLSPKYCLNTMCALVYGISKQYVFDGWIDWFNLRFENE